MPQSSTVFHIAEPSALLVRRWPGEDEYIVFNTRSGDLHLLNPPAAAILQRLGEGPTSLDELCAVLEAQDRETLGTLLKSLDQLGLISPLPL